MDTKLRIGSARAPGHIPVFIIPKHADLRKIKNIQLILGFVLVSLYINLDHNPCSPGMGKFR